MKRIMVKRVDYNAFNDELLQSLLKKDLKELTPEQASESWELIRSMYASKRRKRWLAVFSGVALVAVSAAVVGIAWRRSIRRSNEVRQ